MKKYLKLSDVITGKVTNFGSEIRDELCTLGRIYGPQAFVEHVSHAINSHDELVAMNKELLDVIERVIGSSEKFDKVMGTSEWADGYKQCAIDTGEALRGILDAMKARAAS